MMPERKAASYSRSNSGSSARHDLASTVRASPAARFAAAKFGLDLAAVTGSGPHGRIVLRDVEDHSSHISPRDVRHSLPQSRRGRRGISQVVQAWPTRPVLAQANLSANCQLNALLRARQAHNSTVGTSKEGPLPSSTGGVVSLSALFVKALAISLAQVPAANVVLAGDRLIRQTHCDIAFARSSLDGRVDFPSLVDAHLKAAWDITRELNTLMAVEGDPASSSLEAQLKGVNDRKPTAAIANLGRGAVSSYQTPLSPSHATVIAIPSATPRLVPPVAADLNQGALAPVQDWHSVMNLEITLGCDTRMMSGVIAADLLETFIAQLEQPEHLFAERLF